MTDSTFPAERKRQPVSRTFWIWLIVLAGLAVMLACAGLMFPLEIAYHLLVGSVLFLIRQLNEIQLDAVQTASFATLVAVFAWLAHACLRWLAQRMGWPAWRRRRTGQLVSGGLALSLAGVCLTAAAHQTLWIVNGDEPWLTSWQIVTRSQSRSNLKQIGLGVHNHVDSQSFIAVGFVDGEGQLLHSWITWITQLLPFFEEQKLVDQIDLTASWRSDANREPLSTPLIWVINPGMRRRLDPQTRRPLAIADYALNSQLIDFDRPLSFNRFTDGTANTILAGEVSESARAWGDPVNWRYPGNGFNAGRTTFGSPWVDGVQFLMADGATRFISKKIEPSILQALSSPDGGEPVNDF